MSVATSLRWLFEDSRSSKSTVPNGVRSVAGGPLADWSWTLLAGELSQFLRRVTAEERLSPCRHVWVVLQH